MYDDPRCPRCGRRHGREVKQDDPCLLTEKDVLWGGLLEDVLQQNGIPFLSRKRLGSGLTAEIGCYLEKVSYFVPYAQIEAAQALVDELFSGEPGELPEEEEPEA